MITWIFNLFAALTSPQLAKHTTARPPTVSTSTHPIRGKTVFLERDRMDAAPMGRHTTPSAKASVKPLRIIQWVESAGTSHPSNRRMVMSGRLADICAELDRLAAMESA